MSWDSKHYKEHAKAQEATALQILEKIPFHGSENILDIGCGDGKITKWIAGKVPLGKVIGIDLSESMIREACSSYGSIANLSFFQRNAENFSFSEKFHLITSFFALHWVKNHENVFKNIKACLDPKGTILFLIPAGGNPQIGEVFEREPWKSHIAKQEQRFQSIIADDYREFLNKQGFVQDEYHIRHYPHPFSDILTLKNHFMTWLPSATGLPGEQCQQMALELAENISKHQQTKTNIIYSTSILYIRARPK